MADRIKALEREKRELRKANEICGKSLLISHRAERANSVGRPFRK